MLTVRSSSARGDWGTSLFVIEQGQVAIVRRPQGDRQAQGVVLAVFRAGDHFGELAVLDGKPRSADAIAEEDCRLVSLGREDFLRFLDDHPKAAHGVLAVLSKRLRQMSELLDDAIFSDAAAKGSGPSR